ncbi:MgtC/SapB family protein [Streptomyces benahoarensis]|uniref:MgtC/SapB family protein n=1 Tax=Streptomyces benahoarensis TaxID=2595054 RepID=A0A553XQ91_9ACTN|nr:MgtC/SapB family protein [Streptomyces benahoarensis]TSB19118.1 MgtC/SapB family protein [Streptomyces benahoarensis]TSB19126.1 MgtC/SapB family protein [Streptomyces benahoarensis]
MSHLPLATPLFALHPGQGPRQFAELALALLLSSLIGLEREARQKSAGLRTHTLVGVGSALFMEVSIHGFGGMLGMDGVALDPSRVAAQVVSGIGFIGGGLIFVKKDAVRGLTTAATIWLTCAIGMACGGGLPLLALGATAVHFLIVRGFAKVSERIGATPSPERFELRLTYRSQWGLLGRMLELCTGSGFLVSDVQVETGPPEGAAAEVLLRLEGTASAHALVEALAELDGVRGVQLGRQADSTE